MFTKWTPTADHALSGVAYFFDSDPQVLGCFFVVVAAHS